MTSVLRVRLADGSEIDATIEGALPANLSDLLAVGYHGTRMRIAADESADVSGHALATSVLVKLFDEDDVEGHALTLHLPSAQAAQDLQKKLLAAGIAGLIVVGAATTAVVAPDLTSPGGPVAAPAPVTQTIPGTQDAATQYQLSTDYGQSVVPPVAQGVYPTTGAVSLPTQPTVAPGLSADIATGDATAPTIPQAAVPPGVAGEIAGGDMAASDYGQSVVPPVAQGIYPAGGAKAVTPVPGEQSIPMSGAVTAPGYGQSVVPDVAQGVYPAASSQSHEGWQQAPSQAPTDFEVHGGYQAAPSQATDTIADYTRVEKMGGEVTGAAESHAGYQAAPSQATDTIADYTHVEKGGGDIAAAAGLAESHAGWQQAPSQAADAPGWADPSRPHVAPAGAGWADPSRPHVAPTGESNTSYTAAPGVSDPAGEHATMSPGLKADIATGDVDEGTDPAPPSDRIGGR